MMQDSLNYETAVGSMHMISEVGRKGFLDGIGISKPDFDRCVGPEMWTTVDRNRMNNTFFALLNASIDQCGRSRFTIPAEFIAAGIAVFIHPSNAQLACDFFAVIRSAEELGSGMPTATPCSREQLFALVCQLYRGDQRNAARSQFEKNTGLALEKVMGKK